MLGQWARMETFVLINLTEYKLSLRERGAGTADLRNSIIGSDYIEKILINRSGILYMTFKILIFVKIGLV